MHNRIQQLWTILRERQRREITELAELEALHKSFEDTFKGK
jgi:hypothetical protein